MTTAKPRSRFEKLSGAAGNLTQGGHTIHFKVTMPDMSADLNCMVAALQMTEDCACDTEQPSTLLVIREE